MRGEPLSRPVPIVSNGTGTTKEIRIVNEDAQTDPIVLDLVRRVQEVRSFLTLAAIELRRLAERAPDIAVELVHVARQMEIEAEHSLAAIPDEVGSIGTRLKQ